MEKIIHVVIPCHNEEGNIHYLIDEIDKYIKPVGYRYRYIFIDDGSTDNTFNVISEVSKKRLDVTVVKLSRNFGKEASIALGLEWSSEASAVIIIDSDLQHPPSLIPVMIQEWVNGADIVDGVKVTRQKETFVNKVLGVGFNRIISSLSGMDFAGSSDFKLLDKKAVSIINSIEEKNRFFRGLTNWVGLQHSKVEFKVEQRRAGQTKWNIFKLFQLSVDAITSYSSKPLQIVTVLGAISLVFSIIIGAQTLWNKFLGGAVSGFTTVILVTLILSSIIMMSIGILGIYLAKIYNEIKRRPLYVVESFAGAEKNCKTVGSQAPDETYHLL